LRLLPKWYELQTKSRLLKNPKNVLNVSKMSYKKYQKITPKKGTFGAKIDL
jgi:hypothetical protein